MWCEFAKLKPRNTWYFSSTRTGKMRSPKYGAGQQGIPPAGKRAIKRCPSCNKRLQLRATYCVGGEFTEWKIPAHSIRETRRPGPRRKSNTSGRGR